MNNKKLWLLLDFYMLEDFPIYSYIQLYTSPGGVWAPRGGPGRSGGRQGMIVGGNKQQGSPCAPHNVVQQLTGIRDLVRYFR